MLTDLFGNEHPEPAPRSAIGARTVQLDLLTHASERAALITGRPVSQERAEIAAPNPRPYGSCPICGGPLLLEAGHPGGLYSCPRCA